MKQKIVIPILIAGLATFALGWFLNGARLHNSEHNINNETENFATKISGRFIMKDANCAGFNFISPTLVIWTNEMGCWSDTLKIRWLDNAIFYTQDIVQHNENCPPRVWIYQVVSFDGEKLVLKDIWTGWNDFKDEKLEFRKHPDEKLEISSDIEIDSIIENVLDLVSRQEIVKDKIKLIDSLSQSQRGISLLPIFEDKEKNICLVNVCEDNGVSLVTYFNFLVDVNEMKIINPTGKLDE